MTQRVPNRPASLLSCFFIVLTAVALSSIALHLLIPGTYNKHMSVLTSILSRSEQELYIFEMDRKKRTDERTITREINAAHTMVNKKTSTGSSLKFDTEQHEKKKNHKYAIQSKEGGNLTDETKYSKESVRRLEKQQFKLEISNNAALTNGQSLQDAQIHKQNGSEQSTSNVEKNVRNAQSNKKNSFDTNFQTRYLIYICDIKYQCFGFSDRQRAIVGVYYLAELTNRRFGMTMTTPADFREYYEPNSVNWDVASLKIPPNATTTEILALGKSVNLHLDVIDFNLEYPQDVIYMRTNQELWHALLKNPIYRHNLPRFWSKISDRNVFPVAWLRLMRPTSHLRNSLNSELVGIAGEILEEQDTWKKLEGSSCCQRTYPPDVPVCGGAKATVCEANKTLAECCFEYAVANIKCPELRNSCPFVDYSNCSAQLSLNLNGSKNDSHITALALNYCTNIKAMSRYNDSIDSIRRLTGYNSTGMNFACFHRRVGDHVFFNQTDTLNSDNSTFKFWRLIQSYVQEGHHVYLASDSQQFKDDTKAIFGKRLHTIEKRITHVDYARTGEEAKAGMQFALTEQLLLATSCTEIHFKNSSFSRRANLLRIRLQVMAENEER